LAVEYLERAFFEEIENLVYDMAITMQDFLVDSFIDKKGLTYGDVDNGTADRIQKFIDEEQTGVNAALRTNNPDEYQKRLNQFRRDVESSGLAEDLTNGR